MLRVLHIINNLGSGGAEKLLEESLPILNDYDGITVELLLLTNKNNVFDKGLKKSGVKIYILQNSNILDPINIFRIRRHIIRGNYNIIHAHLFPTNYWTALTKVLIWKKRPKFILTEHSTFNKRRKVIGLKIIEKFIYSRYDKVISISEKTQENLHLWLDINGTKLREKFMVIKNGLNVEKISMSKPYKKSEINGNFSENTKLLCMVGRFSPAKDQETIIRAIERLDPNTHLLLVGEGELEEKNKKLAKELNISNRVHFLGFRNDVYEIIKTVDLVVLSSNWEGFGLAAVEGMAAGKPVIATDVPGLREVVKDAGILFEKGNPTELEENIKFILNDEDEYRRVSTLCQDRAEIYTINRMTDDYLKLYKNVL